MCNNFFYLRGGTERCMFDLMDLLKSKGHHVIPFSMHHEKNDPSAYNQYFLSNINYGELVNKKTGLRENLKAAGRVLYSLEAKKQIRKLIEESKPDIAHLHGIDHQLSPSILDEIKRSGIPIIQTLHDFKLLCPNTLFISGDQICENCKGGKYYQVVLQKCKRQSLSASFLAGLSTYFHKFLKIFERNVDVFISPSQFLINKFHEHGTHIPIKYIPNFINSDRFYPIDQPSNYFLYYGRLSRIKGLSTLIEAVKRETSLHLYIAGEGEMKEELENLIKEEKISNITLLGHLNTIELIPWIQKAMFTVIPSQNLENCPMVILESFACGTPVLGSNLGGIPELIQDGDSGMLFEPGNFEQLSAQIRDLSKNPQKAIAMGRKGRQRIEVWHDQEKYYQKISTIYKDLVDRYRAGIPSDESSTVGIN